jgi:hypothetical protein
MTPSGINPATSVAVAVVQCLNHCATACLTYHSTVYVKIDKKYALILSTNKRIA